MNKSVFRILLLLVVVIMAAVFNACRKDVPPQVPVTWFLNHDDSIKCRNIDRRDTLVFIYNDSAKNYSRLITAVKTKTEDKLSQSQAQDVDPSRNMGASITVHFRKYTYWDSINNFPLVITIAPTFDQTGTIRLPSRFEMLFDNSFSYRSYIHKNGLPHNYAVYDYLDYNNRHYRNCYYNTLALERNLGLQILDATAFPLWLENKVQKINVDFLP